MGSEAPSTSLHPLITQALVETKKYYCPFLEKGYCREASRCNFSHDNYVSVKIPPDYCHFYLANQCLHGLDCRFRHIEPTEEISNENASNNINSESSTSSSSNDCLEQFAELSISHNHHHNYPYQELIEGEPYQLNPGEVENFACASNQIGFAGHCSSFGQALVCDLCGRPCLNPNNSEQQRQHREDCLREHELEMELSFAVQRSKDKVCGICMDTVVEKKPITSSRFGILEKCNHIFCLDCIRKWRGTKQFETRTIRACPECRVSSDFVVPSKYWIEDQEDKEKLIRDYKAALRSKPCKYFNEGKGDCPFAGSCFYKHAYPDGSIAKLETPTPRRRVYGARGPTSVAANYILWNILTSTDDDDWSNDDIESLYLDPDFGSDDEETTLGDDLDEEIGLVL